MTMSALILLQIFKEYVTKSEEALQVKQSGSAKSATASAAGQAFPTQNTDTSYEWLAETNALKAEKARAKLVCASVYILFLFILSVPALHS